MIRYYTSRDLSRKLGVNLAKWKRWAREFLPPDPLGGMQSGYARQYSPDEAFSVHLGGHLVAHLNLPVPGAKRILEDLGEWLLSNGFYSETPEGAGPEDGLQSLVRQRVVFITQSGPLTFAYTVRGTILTEPAEHSGHTVTREYFVETSLDSRPPPASPFERDHVKVLNITSLLKSFVVQLDLEATQYRALT